MVSKKLIQSIVNVKKLHTSVSKLDKQFEYERIVNKARITRTKDLKGKLSSFEITYNGTKSVKSLLDSRRLRSLRSRF